MAVQWFRKAAEQGDAAGQNWLGLMYQEGRGVPQNYVYAHMWTNIATSDIFGFGQWTIYDEEMTSSQIKEAKELARECIRKQYKGCEVQHFVVL